MREALDNTDGQDDVTRQTSGLFLGDDYKEVKDHVVLFVWLLFQPDKSSFNLEFIQTDACQGLRQLCLRRRFHLCVCSTPLSVQGTVRRL